MRFAFIFGCVLGLALAVFTRPAEASELRLTTVQGANIRTWYAPGATATASASSGSYGMKLSIQCPTDGGAGQKIYYRPGCLPSTRCAADAGPGDAVIDFTSNPDPYQIDLAGHEDRVHLASVTGYASTVYCNVYRRSP